jgi:hypothetical protein
VARPTDESKIGILPEAELNPLLNPLLSTHMGRWAEVYFTSPPEKRAQAVSDLVRELSNNPTSETASAQSVIPPRFSGKMPSEPKMYDDPIATAPPAAIDSELSRPIGGEPPETLNFNQTVSNPIVCEACGHDNEPQQRFCGMCGTSLLHSANQVSSSDEPGFAEHGLAEQGFAEPDSTSALAESASITQSSSPHSVEEEKVEEERFEEERFEEKNPQPIPAPTWIESRSARESATNSWNESNAPSSAREQSVEDYPAVSQSAWAPTEDRPAEYSQFNGLSAYESEPASHGYRIYIGLVVAVLLGLLVYITWRSNNALRSSGGVLPQAVPSAKSEPPEAAQSAPPSAPQPQANTGATEPPSSTVAKSAQTATATPEKRPAAHTAPATVARSAPARPAPGRTPTARSTADHGKKNHPAPRSVPVRAQTPATSELDGAEELAAAEKYLNGGSGSARNSQQAASLLWKAVAKQNSTATLLLSDLYLRGDGVAKSCDQARLLLDAAARKGQTAAAERLRNLPAFGCR